ncbi:MAG: hypothetical protein JWN06_2646 [Propionibacteriaceae bacterium]|jgi:hypothetical protein|nr:hypothetical protein [Propionibacteriaceae bacterium]
MTGHHPGQPRRSDRDRSGQSPDSADLLAETLARTDVDVVPLSPEVLLRRPIARKTDGLRAPRHFS